MKGLYAQYERNCLTVVVVLCTFRMSLVFRLAPKVMVIFGLFAVGGFLAVTGFISLVVNAIKPDVPRKARR